MRTDLSLLSIYQGLHYLHGSPLQSHGHLRSTTCLIDSRWQIKLTSFGLHFFKQGETTDHGEYQVNKKLLWTAPEILRLPETERPPHGSQKGDVYSFGIILQEIVYRAMPFFMDLLSPKGRNLDINNTFSCFCNKSSDKTSISWPIMPDLTDLQIERSLLSCHYRHKLGPCTYYLDKIAENNTQSWNISEVLARVMALSTPPYRPDSEAPEAPEDTSPDLVLLMALCWEERPEKRPTLGEIKSEMKKINKGRYASHIHHICTST